MMMTFFVSLDREVKSEEEKYGLCLI